MGHVLHFEEAASLGDILVVTITADKFITKKRSVSFTEEYRMRQVAALEIVDYVALVNDPSAVPALEALEPDVYVKGSEYANLVLDKTANIFREKHLVEAYGGRIHFTTGETFSSTKLSHFLLASPEAVQDNPLLRNERVLFRDLSEFSFKLEELKTFLVRASQLRVCLLGETIVDEWVDISVTNLSQKSRCVAGTGDGQDPADRRDRHHRAAPGQLREADRLLHERRRSATAPPNVTVTPLSREPARQDPVRRSGQRVAAVRVEGARHSRRAAASCPISTTTISCWWPISGTACSTPGQSTGRSPEKKKCVRRGDGAGELEQLRLQPAGQVRRRRLLQLESHRGRAVAARKGSAVRRADRADGGGCCSAGRCR